MVRHYWPQWNSPEATKEIENFFGTIRLWETRSGRLWTIHRVKTARLILTRSFSGSPLSAPFGISVNKETGLPKLIPQFLVPGLKDRDPDSFRLAMTLLNVTRAWLGGTPVDLTAIITPGKPEDENFKIHIREFLDLNKIRGYTPSWVRFHWTAKMGPNGPAMASSILESRLIPEPLMEAIRVLGGLSLHRVIGKIRNLPDNTFAALLKATGVSTGNLLRRLSVKKDREGKSRPFAMLDYYSQTSLMPLHEQLFEHLRKIPQDRTFTQADQLRVLAPPGNKYHSLDLTAATDRFPIWLQVQVLSELISPKVAQAWRLMMVDTPFELAGRTYKYAAGQPMGAYSSWALFALTHHYVVFLSAKRAGVELTSETYCLLGDDIVIANDAVAEQYRLIMSELGVELSEHKSHVSEDTYEFAKRWFHKGMEITPYPVHGVLENQSRHYAVVETLKQASKRGYPLPSSWQPGLFYADLVSALGARGRMIPYIERRMLLISILPSVVLDDFHLADRARAFFSISGADYSCNWSDSRYVSLLSSAAGQAWDKLIHADAERLQDALGEMSNLFEDVLSEATAGAGDQPDLDELISILPPVAALQERAQEATETIDID